MIPLTVPEVRRLLSLVAVPVEQQRFHLHWSWWRRAHQAVAQRGHRARRARGQPPVALTTNAPVVSAAPRTGTPLAALWRAVSDAQWARVQPVLPAAAGIGRPPYEARMVVDAVLWRQAHDASWRSLPAAFGRWNTICRRFQVWQHTGLWPRILDALRESDPPHEVSL